LTTSINKQYGNAADALVATALCIGVVAPYHSGIGGGGFGLVYNHKNTSTNENTTDGSRIVEFVDFRETAPGIVPNTSLYFDAKTKDWKQGYVDGAEVAVPSELKGLEYIHSKYGRLSWKSIVCKIASLARDGWTITDDAQRYTMSVVDREVEKQRLFEKSDGNEKTRGNFLINDPTWSRDFAPNGTLLKGGEKMTRERYADTLDEIAEYGIQALYSPDGKIGKSIVETVGKYNGTMTMDDLTGYDIKIRNASMITYGNYTIYSSSAPASGMVVLTALKALEGWSSSVSTKGRNSQEISEDNVEMIHRYIQVLKLSYQLQKYIDDPSFSNNNNHRKHEWSIAALKGESQEDLQAHVLSPPFVNYIKSIISDNTSIDEIFSDGDEVHDEGTSHISVTDSFGLTISLTTTVNHLFGSHIMDEKTGIVLNGEMSDFKIPDFSSNHKCSTDSSQNNTRGVGRKEHDERDTSKETGAPHDSDKKDAHNNHSNRSKYDYHNNIESRDAKYSVSKEKSKNLHSTNRVDTKSTNQSLEGSYNSTTNKSDQHEDIQQKNIAHGGKRPVSSISPIIITNTISGDVVAVLGAAGGPRIIPGVLWTTYLIVEYGYSVEEANRATRIVLSSSDGNCVQKGKVRGVMYRGKFTHKSCTDKKIIVEEKKIFQDNTSFDERKDWLENGMQGLDGELKRKYGYDVQTKNMIGWNAVQAIGVEYITKQNHNGGEKVIYTVAGEPRQKNSGGNIV